MTKLTFNNNSLNQTVIPSINSTIDQLSKAINKRSELYIPSDFYYYNTLNSILDSNAKISKDLISVKNLIIDSNKELENTLAEVETDCRNINNIIIGKRESYIK